MEKELEKRLLELLEKSVDGLDQIPEVAEQFLNYMFYVHLFDIAIYLAVIICSGVGIFFTVSFLTRKKREAEGTDYWGSEKELIAGIGFLFLVVTVASMIFGSIPQTIKNIAHLKISPVTYVIKNLAGKNK